VMLRELRQARAEKGASAEKFLEGLLNAHMDEINRQLTKESANLQAVIRHEEKRTRLHYSDLIGRNGSNLILRTCGIVLHLVLPKPHRGGMDPGTAGQRR
jgi:hypothetical protein